MKKNIETILSMPKYQLDTVLNDIRTLFTNADDICDTAVDKYLEDKVAYLKFIMGIFADDFLADNLT